LGVLALDSRTRNLKLVFRSGAEAELDLLLNGSDLLVNDKWLDFQRSHQFGGCELMSEAFNQHVDIDSFDYGHIITELYDLILVELSSLPRQPSVDALHADGLWRRKVGERIRQTPYRVEISTQGCSRGELRISWTEFESERVWKKYGLVRKGQVTLHREKTCFEKKDEFICQGDLNFEPIS